MEQEKKTGAQKGQHKGASLLMIGLGVVVIFVGLFFVVPSPSYTVGFKAIDEVMKDGAKKDELVPPETKDFRSPTWANYQKKNNPGYVGRKISNVLSLIGLKGRPNWSPSYYKYLLEKHLAARVKAGLKKHHVVRIAPNEKARFLVWGDLSGAYHSFARGLKKAVELGILKDDLTLKSPNDYIVFTGDAVNRTPFIMETQSLLLTLMERNPGKFIYVRGSDEWKGYWHPYGLQEEFVLKAGHLASRDYFTKTVDEFFDTLPLALYVSVAPHTSNEFIRFSHYAIAKPSTEAYKERVELLDDRYYSAELLKDRGKEKVIALEKKDGDFDPELVTVRAVVKSMKKSKHARPGKGFNLLEPDRQATAWNFRSNPIVIAQKMVGFFSDLFSVIESAPKLDDWTITFYYRDIRKKEDFAKESYNFISGKKL